MHTSSHGLVSIIMPTYNCAGYIGSSIESILHQTYEDWELVIVDDCSTDNTHKVVEKYADERIKYYRLQNNRGAAIARNHALTMARGKWIAFLDSDDLWYVTKLHDQLNFMVSNNYNFSYTNYDLIDQQGVRLNRIITGPKEISRVGMLCYCWPGCLTVIYNKEVIGDIQIPDIKKNNDYAMWLIASRKARCYKYDDVLASYRLREGSISHTSYCKLIKWHFRLFRMVESASPLKAALLTSGNLVFGVWKKLVYQKCLSNKI